MKTLFTRRVARLIGYLAAISALGGCAVYGTAPAYYGDGGGVVYAAPAPVYVAPPVYANPWYVGPPVFLNFGYRSWGGRGHYRGGYHGGGRHRR